MTALLDEPRIAYASRKVQRLREDVNEWRGERGVLEDQIRDLNQVAEDLLAFDTGVWVTPSFQANRWVDLLGKHAELARQWAATATDILDTIDRAGELPGTDELRKHLEEAKRIATMPPVERVFRELVRVWKEDTYFISSTTVMLGHWAYQQIIQLGRAVVPLILRELRSRPDFLFAALREITGEDPVRAEDCGKVKAMADAWVKWGEANHLI
jgi:hypothetical protein